MEKDTKCRNEAYKYRIDEVSVKKKHLHIQKNPEMSTYCAH